MIGLAYPNISPNILTIGDFALRWYSMAYLVGILAGWWLVAVRVKKYAIGLSKADLEDIAFFMTLGIILGGRLGYILFYGEGQYLQNPLEIFAIWHGGMSFHGGIIGVIVALWLASRKIKFPYLKLTDLVAPVVPIGIFLGRLANFANDELWGRVTDVAWAVRFPRGGYLPRHPSQIYEAFSEGILLFVVLNLLWKNKWCREHTGFLSGIFLLGYSLLRTFVEQFREPDAQIGFLWGGLTMGQCLSLPIDILGVYLLWRAVQPKKQQSSRCN
ncbi:MAG: prolipoprotein diacylglyceryl transferase [Alphaproteobacteria bacterium]|nr:prolipoprotein diacylglyceryl transferase [Alphaproteobacteria bacterium]